MSSDIQHDKPRLNWSAPEMYQEYLRFKAHCDCYFAGPLADKGDKVKIAYLLTFAGDRGREVHSTFTFGQAANQGDPNPKDVLDNVWTKFESYFKPKKNEIRATVKFNRRKQGCTERFDEFVTDLEVLARDCNFGASKDRMIRDAIVLRSYQPLVMEKCFEKSADDTGLSKAEAVSIGQACEVTKKSMSLVTDEGEDPRVNMAYRDRRHKTRRRESSSSSESKSPPRRRKSRERERQKTGEPSRDKHGSRCTKCGAEPDHNRKHCPARNQRCHRCDKRGHFAKLCHKNRPKRDSDVGVAAAVYQREHDDYSSDTSDYEYAHLIK